MRKIAFALPALAAVGIIAGCSSSGSPAAHSSPSPSSLHVWLNSQGGKDFTRFEKDFNADSGQVQAALGSTNVNKTYLASVDAAIISTDAIQAAKLPPPIGGDAYQTAMVEYASAFHLLMNPANYVNVAAVNQATTTMNAGTVSLNSALKAIGGK